MLPLVSVRFFRDTETVKMEIFILTYIQEVVGETMRGKQKEGERDTDRQTDISRTSVIVQGGKFRIYRAS